MATLNSQYELFVTCPKGLEQLLADEVASLGAKPRKVSPAGVELETDLAGTYRCCLWSRLANRVLLVLAQGAVADRQALLQLAGCVDWSRYLAPGEPYWIAAFGESGGIKHSRFGAQVVKDAINDQFRADGKEVPVIDQQRARQFIQLNLRKTTSLCLDLSGRSLHMRGYREEGEAAPLKENLAAALLLRAGWQEHCHKTGVIFDPMCGSGTLVIEAAMMAMDHAPGLLHPRFAVHHAKFHDPACWQEVLADAQERSVLGKRAWRGLCLGSDQNPRVLRAAKRNLAKSGFDRWIEFKQADATEEPVFDLTPPEDAEAFRLLICNPPYGERLGQELELRGLYQNFGRRLKKSFPGWQVGLFTSNRHLAKETGLRADKEYKLFNGTIPTSLFLFEVFAERSERSDAAGVDANRAFSKQAQMLANRINKNRQKLQGWLTQEGIEAYRVYDADIPEYAVAIDVYREYACIQEYAAPKSIPEEKARQRFLDVLEVAPACLSIASGQVFSRQRKPQKGKTQYQREQQRKREIEIQEYGCKLLVNLSDYLDTGLFLDHRPMRKYVQKAAAGKSFLNLFCYTASVSVHAAAGGAKSTTSIDLSNTYLEWAQRNYALNGLLEKKGHSGQSKHRFIRADAMHWLEQADEKFDLVFFDPPTFSNSKSMQGTWDTQRDHGKAITLVMQHLQQDGLLIFSNNFRRFKLDPGLTETFQVEDQTQASIPRDFSRNRRIHQCWFIRHRSD